MNDRTGPNPKIVFAALEKRLADAWQESCADLPGVEVYRGSILDIACDAVVSPANSFGFMDGGIDALYTDRFGGHVEARLRRLILDRHRGELLVGTAEIVDTDNPAIPFLIAAPTMRVPMVLPPETINPYLAMRAALLLVQHGVFAAGALAGERVATAVRRVAVPGMGTGVGRVDPKICARQCRAAIEEHLLGGFRLPTSWAEASERHQLLYADRARDLQY